MAGQFGKQCKYIFWLLILTLSTLKTKADTYANSVDPDETAHNEPSHQDLYCLQLCVDFLMISLLATMDMPKFNDRKVHFINSWWIGLNLHTFPLFPLQPGRETTEPSSDMCAQRRLISLLLLA